MINLDKEDIENIEICFSDYDFEIKDMGKCIEYLKNNFCLFSYEEIIERFCQNNEIKCPMRYLDTDMIYSGIQFSYFEINDDLFLDTDFVFQEDEIIKEMEKQGIVENKTTYGW